MFFNSVILTLLYAAASAVTVSKDVDDLQYFYYPTASGSRQELKYNDASSLSGLKTGAPTTVIIDGFLSDGTSPMSQALKDAILKTDQNRNVVVLDWGRLSGSGLTFGNLIKAASAYITVLRNVGPVGQRVADFLNFLKVSKNIHPLNVHIVGHSLGAHIAGAAGVFTKSKYQDTLGRISGLDPAGPFFTLQVDKGKRLHSGDAAFVDIYHTNRGTLGDSDHQTGDVNIYVNGGDGQPGCEKADSAGFSGFCSHSYSWKLYYATIYQDIKACPCSGLPCQCRKNCNTSCPSPISIGQNTSPSSRGPYHLMLDNSLNFF